MTLTERVAALPDQPGVYLLKDDRGGILYVGKAKSLRDRVRTYLRASDDERFLIPFLKRRIADVEVIVTDTEQEALLLENNLIKKHRPRYNLQLRDDKSYVNLVLGTNHPFPRLYVARRPKSPGSRVFGPYSSASSVRETVRFLTRMIPLRTCTDHDFANRSRPCLEYEIHRCPAPCVGYIDEKGYGELVEQTTLLLRGRSKDLVERLRAAMGSAAAGLRYEEAGALRDRIRAVERTVERQRVDRAGGVDRDVFAHYAEGGKTQVHGLFFRGGQLTGSRGFSFPWRGPALPPGALYASLLGQYYGGDDVVVPREVLAAAVPDEKGLLEAWLTRRAGDRVEILAPRRGDRAALVAMARKNAAAALRGQGRREARALAVAEELKGRLNLARLPRRIECYDISNLAGTEAVGSCVAFEDGRPDPAGYRKFRVRTAVGGDDTAAMYEVLKRRLLHAPGVPIGAAGKEGGPPAGEGERWRLPDLIVVDGGKAQVNAATAALAEVGIEGVDVAGLAKEAEEAPSGVRRVRRGAGLIKRERVFPAGRKEPVLLDPSSRALHLLMRLRDEAHRFAVSYQRDRRRARDFASLLDRVHGVGPRRRRVLLKHFGGLDRLREAPVEEIARVGGIGPRVASALIEMLRASPGTAA